MLGRRIKTARAMKDWTQAELEQKAQLPPTSVSRIESGQRAINTDELTRLANVLGVTVEWLLNDRPASIPAEATP